MLIDPEVQLTQKQTLPEKTNKDEIEVQNIRTQEGGVQAFSFISPGQMNNSGDNSQKASRFADQMINCFKAFISNLAHQALDPGRFIGDINIPASTFRFTLNDHGLESIQLIPAAIQKANTVTAKTNLIEGSAPIPATENTPLTEHENCPGNYTHARLIKKTYYRRRKKGVSTDHEPVFGSTELEQSTARKRKEMDSSVRILRGHKTNKTPISDSTLRRSARVQEKNKGTKATPADPSHQASAKDEAIRRSDLMLNYLVNSSLLISIQLLSFQD